MTAATDDVWAMFFGTVDPVRVAINRRIHAAMTSPTTDPLTVPALVATVGAQHEAAVLAFVHDLHRAGLVDHRGAGVIVVDDPRAAVAVAAGPAGKAPRKKAARPPARRPKDGPLEVARCRGCNAHILTGSHSGLDYVLDADPLTERGEVMAALIPGATTFTVTTPTRWRIRTVADARKPFPDAATVHRVHRCDAGAVPAEHRRLVTGAPITAPPPPPAFPDTPPF